MTWLHQNLIALDQAVNAFLGGYADETLSSRAYRMQQKHQPHWGWMAQAINKIFFWQKDHCRGAFRAEELRRQLPPEFREIYGIENEGAH
jgi:hypothetical protein